MSKYIDADKFLCQYSILISRPNFTPLSSEMSAWKLWKEEFDRDVVRLISRMATEQKNDEKFIAKIKEIPVVQIPIDDIVRCKDCKYFGYDYEYKHPCCTRIFVHPRVSDNDYCSYAERRKSDDFKMIVRCKNCIHHRYDDESETFTCTLRSGAVVKADGFCSEGERILK